MMDSSSPLTSLASSATSSPLSNMSKTPSLPSSPVMTRDVAKRYPSPMSTIASGTQSPMRLAESAHEGDAQYAIVVSGDSPRPAKRRRVTPPKERTTEYLDLTKPEGELGKQDKAQLRRLLACLHNKKKIVVIAGAGISVSAGIPDFRSSTGMFSTTKKQHKLKASGKHLFDASVYKHDATTQSFHTMVREMAELTQKAEPTPFHHLLATLAHEGRLMRLYTQNIDCIDTSMEPLATKVPLNSKGPWPTTVQLHGGLEKMVCTKCAQLEPFDGSLFDGPEAPLCNACKEDDEVRTTHAGKRSHGIGRLRPRFVLYNEYNPDEEAIGNVSSADLKARPDAVIVVGTTLKVPGTRRLVKELCQATRSRRHGLTVWINTESEPKGVEFRDCWDLVVRSKCDDVAERADLSHWDWDLGENCVLSEAEARERQERRCKEQFTVSIPSKPTVSPPEEKIEAEPKQVGDNQGIPTPQASPKMSPAKRSSKTKQSKISFGVQQPELGQPVKMARPRARKPKKPARAAVPKETVAQSFRAVKKMVGRATDKTLKGKPEGPVVQPEPSATGRGFSPCSPTTPLMPRRPNMMETVSPKSKPKDMENLID